MRKFKIKAMGQAPSPIWSIKDGYWLPKSDTIELGIAQSEGQWPTFNLIRPIAAIDPGASGGMAWITSQGNVETCSMENRKEFISWLSDTICDVDPVIYIEKVAGYFPKPKIAKPGEKEEFNLQASAFSMFNFGKAAGIPIGICEAFGIVPIEVMPAAWQKCCFTSKGKKTRQDWKNELKSIAQRRYPEIKVTLSNADALLILSYGTLITRGQIDLAPGKVKK